MNKYIRDFRKCRNLSVSFSGGRTPLVELGMTKRDVALEIQKWGFDLEIPNDAYGNCVFCWKKSLRKQLTVASQCPEAFNFPQLMERKYGHVNGDTKAANSDGRRYWFKDHMPTRELLKLAEAGDFTPYVDDPYDHGIAFDSNLDTGMACGEGCEIGADE